MSLADTLYATLGPLTTNNRVYPDLIPQGTFTDTQRAPAIRFTLITASPDNTLYGSNVLADTSRIQVDFFAPSRQQLMALVDLARTAISNLTIPPPLRELEVSGYEDDSKLYVYTIDWTFHPSA